MDKFFIVATYEYSTPDWYVARRDKGFEDWIIASGPYSSKREAERAVRDARAHLAHTCGGTVRGKIDGSSEVVER